LEHHGLLKVNGNIEKKKGKNQNLNLEGIKYGS
jgi:hypothetical protein